MFPFYALSFFKKGDTIQGGTLSKEIWYFSKVAEIFSADLTAQSAQSAQKITRF